MQEKILSDIRNKLTAPKIVLEKLTRSEKVPEEFLELALGELETSIELAEKLQSSDVK